MINGDITVKGSNLMIKALITSSLIMGILMGITLCKMAYGEEEPKYEKFEMTADLMERYVDNTADAMFTFSCPNDRYKTFTIWLGNEYMSVDMFENGQAILCGYPKQ